MLELLRGWTLSQRIEQGPLPVREAIRVGVEVAKGLAHAHAQGVIHRDLKPGNIFLCDDGQVKVLDLGMAHAFGHRKLDGGTPAYMAPEQWRGAPEDERTDVFAMGAVLFEMLAGEPPFTGSRDEVERASAAAPQLAVPEEPALGELIRRTLESDPVRRPRDAAEVLAALCAFQHELRAAAPTAVTVRAAPPRARRAACSPRAAVLLLVARRDSGSSPRWSWRRRARHSARAGRPPPRRPPRPSPLPSRCCPSRT